MTIKTWQERFAAHPMATSDVAKLAEIEELRAKLAEYEKRHQTIGNAGTACGEYVEPEKYNPAPCLHQQLHPAPRCTPRRRCGRKLASW